MTSKHKAGTKRWGRESKRDRFCALSFQLIDSEAFKHLSTSALCVLVLLKRCFNGNNNGEIHLSCREVAKKAKISRNTATKAFKELQQKGFITKVQQGYFASGCPVATIWELNTDKNSGECRPSNEWKLWHVGDDFLENPPTNYLAQISATQSKIL